MTTLTYPSLTARPIAVEWRLIARTLEAISPLDLSSQQQEFVGARWGTTLEYRLSSAADVNAMKSFLVKLRGRSNRVAMPNWDRPRPRGTAGGTPLVAGGSQTGASLDTDGWTAGATMLAGDFFSVSGELKMVVADATANGSGLMTLTFEPPLRASPADNAALTVASPTCTMIQTEDLARWSPQASSRPDRLYDFTLQFVEVFA